eukprot:UN04415
MYQTQTPPSYSLSEIPMVFLYTHDFILFFYYYHHTPPSHTHTSTTLFQLATSHTFLLKVVVCFF